VRKRSELPEENRRFHEVILEVLRDSILKGNLVNGLVLGETEVGRLFGVSRTPATLALAQLHSEGLIQRFNGRGFLVGASKKVRLSRQTGLALGVRVRH